jgi:hypothetical protein
MTREDVRERLAALEAICEQAEAEDILKALRAALRARHRLLVARAAELTASRLLYDLEPALREAFDSFRVDPLKRDAGCIAKGAIVRALVALDCLDAEFFIAGIHYRQPEPVWGGHIDTAVDLRISCAMGLVATSHPRTLMHLVDLLYDPEPRARSGAARAIACTQPIAAEAVLRGKILGGDAEPEVTGDCLAALLEVAAEDALDFVAGFLDAPDDALRGMAALALGASPLDGALEHLRARWEAEPLKRDQDRMLLRGAALHRSEAAVAWLLEVVASGDLASAEVVIDELAAYRDTAQTRQSLHAAVVERDEPRLLGRYGCAFPAREGAQCETVRFACFAFFAPLRFIRRPTALTILRHACPAPDGAGAEARLDAIERGGQALTAVILVLASQVVIHYRPQNVEISGKMSRLRCSAHARSNTYCVKAPSHKACAF